MGGNNTSEAMAVWFEAPRVASLRKEEVPKPGPREITVRSLYSLVSSGTEMNFYRGETGVSGLLMPTTKGTMPFPISFAYQTVGVVEEAGAGSGFITGEVVLARHPHQSRFTVRPEDARTLRVPSGCDPLRAVFGTLFSVAHHTALVAPIRPGDCVVVSGLGLVGTFTGFLARKNAGKLIFVDPSAERRRRCKWIGADVVVSPDDLRDAVQHASEGRGVDVYIETSGAPAALQAALTSTGVQGTIAVSAWYGTRPVTLSLTPEFHLKGPHVISCQVSLLPGELASRWSLERRAAVSFDFLSTIDVDQLISHRIDFKNAPDAYRLIDSGPDKTLGVVLVHSA